ncbi:MAG: hypothetical protein WC988_03435 [Patescibacteria group bacterium]
MRIKVEIRASEAAKVPKYIKRLKTVISRSKKIGLEQALAEWANEIASRRLAWFKQNRDCLTRLKGTEVRKGFQLVMLEYMGINPKEIPIVKETKTKITWHAHDFCPYFEAIQQIGLDTRIVCKFATEKPCQALLDAYNPKLRFSRNYQKIRPNASFCEETIELVE